MPHQAGNSQQVEDSYATPGRAHPDSRGLESKNPWGRGWAGHVGRDDTTGQKENAGKIRMYTSITISGDINIVSPPMMPCMQ